MSFVRQSKRFGYQTYSQLEENQERVMEFIDSLGMSEYDIAEICEVNPEEIQDWITQGRIPREYKELLSGSY